MKFDNNQQAFLALLKAGLWEKEVRLLAFEEIDYSKIYRLSEEQSVIGLVSAGLEHVVDKKLPKETTLNFIGATLQLEQKNSTMNIFIGDMIEKMRSADIYALIMKGQGIAQCYERPLWRACGDIDLLLCGDNYQKGIDFFTPLASFVDKENEVSKHIAINIGPWEVELHGSLTTDLWVNLDKTLEEVRYSIFYGGNVRTWNNNRIQVFLPRSDEDVFYVFAHILQHFFKGGIGLRQLCDWCRLLWSYKGTIDLQLLEKRLKKAGVMSEWKAFASLAVNTLDMPAASMPFYSSSPKWKAKANRILKSILKTGNFGHNRDMSYVESDPVLIRKIKTFRIIFSDFVCHSIIFPKDSLAVLKRSLIKGMVGR